MSEEEPKKQHETKKLVATWMDPGKREVLKEWGAKQGFSSITEILDHLTDQAIEKDFEPVSYACKAILRTEHILGDKEERNIKELMQKVLSCLGVVVKNVELNKV